MKLPNGDLAIVRKDKLEKYCLDLDHPDGKHKARAFLSVFGLTSADSDELRERILEAARVEEAMLAFADGYGQRYYVDFLLTRMERTAKVRSCWIIALNDPRPWLTSCYVLSRRKQ